MAVAVQSITTTAWAQINWVDNLNTFVQSKPTGLAVGDLMIAQVANGGLAGAYTAPSGWTLIRDDANSTVVRSALFYKIADSGDVAASTFTWTANLGTNSYMGGVILRIDGHSSGNPLVGNGGDATVSNTATPSFACGITPSPAVADSMYMLIATAQQNDNATGGYAIVTSDPTWTEQWDIATSSSSHYSTAGATGTRTAVTATGNASVTGGDATADWVGQLIAIAPSKSHTQTDTITTSEPANTYLRARIFSQADTITTSETVTSALARAWTNLTKSASSIWTNQDQS